MEVSILEETVHEGPVLDEYVEGGGNTRRCEVYASQLVNVNTGDVVASVGCSGSLLEEGVHVTVAHRTESTVVLLVERTRWAEGEGTNREARLVAVALASRA